MECLRAPVAGFDRKWGKDVLRDVRRPLGVCRFAHGGSIDETGVAYHDSFERRLRSSLRALRGVESGRDFSPEACLEIPNNE